MLVPSGTSSNIHSQYSLAHSVYFSIAISSPCHFLILFCISPFTVVYPLHNAPPLGNSAALIYLQPEQWAPDERLGRDRKEHSLLVTDLSHQRGRVQWHPLPGALRHCTSELRRRQVAIGRPDQRWEFTRGGAMGSNHQRRLCVYHPPG
jgi:hypothetical protein